MRWSSERSGTAQAYRDRPPRPASRLVRTSVAFFIVWVVLMGSDGARRLTLPALTVLLSLASAGCTFGSGEASPTTPPSGVTGPSPTPSRAFVRTCETSVYGKLDASGWKNHSVFAGPLVFYYADQFAGQPASDFAPFPAGSSYYAGQKLLVLLRRGAVATVLVPESKRRNAGLLFDPAEWNDRNTYRIEDADSAVRFKACKKGEKSTVGAPPTAMTQFNGGFVVAGARCLPLEVRVPGRGTIPVSLSFGAGPCA